MPLVVYNTLKRKKEIFEPINPPNVGMYVCGITPYDETHLGHGRAYVAFDVIRRYLEYCGYKVLHIQNITDIDDKIIKKANDQEKSIEDISKFYSNSYFEAMDKLKVKRASNYPFATAHISEMINLISDLIAKGCAYAVDGDVYFNIQNFERYGGLSHRNLDGMIAGARISVNEKKKNPLDFTLWKASKENEPFWDSPWGQGRPGWHTECVVMSKKYLGEYFDIHGGGADLIFPHHENELAQAECCHGGAFVKYWLHNGFVTIDKEKMSKSLGNFFSISEILMQYDPCVVRYFLIKTHYRSPLNFSFDELEESKAALSNIKNSYEDILFMLKSSKNDRSQIKFDIGLYKEKFTNAMDDDFNTSAAIASIFEMIKFYHENKFHLSGEDIGNIKNLMDEFNNVLQLGLKENKIVIKEDINDLVKKRKKARDEKNFELSDKLRVEIEERGYIIEDTPFGSFVKKK